MRQFTLSAAAVLVLLTTAPAAAASDRDTMSVTVAMSDLDLGKASDLARLDARINRAANVVCGSGDVRGTQARNSFTNCKTAAMRAARTQTERAVASATGAAPKVLASRR